VARTTPNWASVEPVPRNRLVPGTVVWAHIDFVDGTGEKPRPAVVIDVRGSDVIVLPGTTSERRHASADHVELRDLDRAGLVRSTGICARPRVVGRIDLTCICGSLGEEDHRRVLDAVSTSTPSAREVSERAAV